MAIGHQGKNGQYSRFSVIRSFCQICQICITVEKNKEKNIPLVGLELQTLGLFAHFFPSYLTPVLVPYCLED